MCTECDSHDSKRYTVGARRLLVAREPEECAGDFSSLEAAQAACDALFEDGCAIVFVLDRAQTKTGYPFYAKPYERRLPISGYSLFGERGGPGSTWNSGGAPHERERLLAEMEEMLKSGDYSRVTLSERLWEDGERVLISATTLDELYPTPDLKTEARPRARASALAG
jgi:hypothetical protein